MDLIKSGWFSEVNDLCPGLSVSLEVKSVLYEGKSDYHDIMVLDTERYGKVLILDGIIQCCDFDEFAYQEMISFLPLYSHTNPQKVLIVGGGHGGVAREVCKHSLVTEVCQVEIDQKIIDTSKEYLPSIAEGLSHSKLKLYVEDELKFIENQGCQFDIIITDSSDPNGPPSKFLSKEYFELLKKALKPDGIICSQVGSPWTDLDLISESFDLCQDVFPSVALAVTSVPTYSTGQTSFILASLNKETYFKWPRKTLKKEDSEEMKLQYYTSDVHLASFLLPKFVEESLGLGLDEETTGWKRLFSSPNATVY